MTWGSVFVRRTLGGTPLSRTLRQIVILQKGNRDSVKKRLSVMTPMAKLQLTETDVRELTELKWNGRTREERWRASVIVDCGKGLRRAEVAERNDCKIAGVDKTLMRFRSEGVAGLLSRRLKPHVRKVRQRGLDLLDAAIRQTPRTMCPDDPTFDRSLWTLALLRDYLVSQGVARVDDDTIRRYLLLLGWTTKSAKLRCSSPDPDYQEKMAAIEGLHEQAQKRGLALR